MVGFLMLMFLLLLFSQNNSAGNLFPGFRVPIRMPREPRCGQNGLDARKGDEAAPKKWCGEES